MKKILIETFKKYLTDNGWINGVHGENSFFKNTQNTQNLSIKKQINIINIEKINIFWDYQIIHECDIKTILLNENKLIKYFIEN